MSDTAEDIDELKITVQNISTQITELLSAYTTLKEAVVLMKDATNQALDAATNGDNVYQSGAYESMLAAQSALEEATAHAASAETSATEAAASAATAQDAANTVTGVFYWA